ncbi:MAG: thiamine pyrophosphate-dependent dehydrogenase E1 component subunit alpha, partial [Alteromonas sp.]|nr:thiamine pyrophosphate-dependent dehydrogenase E1 component subunit alpha [Alteromonas sp.]
YRWKGHVGPEADYKKGVRPKEELEAWIEKCPLKRYEQFLTDRQPHLSAAQEAIATAINSEIESALAFARSSPFPEPKELFDDVYARL